MKKLLFLMLVGFAVVLQAQTKIEEIYKAIDASDLNKVKVFIEADPTILKLKDGNGFTILHKACFTGKVEIANFLIDKGAEVNVRDNFEQTPLHRACYFPNQDAALIQHLIEKGAEVNLFGYNGITPLHWAARSGNLKVARLLIDNGAEVNVYDKYKGPIGTGGISGTILQVAINSGSKNFEMVKLIIDRGAKLNQKDSFGNTELHLVALKGYADLARLLVKHSTDINAVNKFNRTALYYAAKHGYRSVADVLIGAGAKENTIVESNYGKAPQLKETLSEGEAYIWYLGGGYAVKTKGHLILFNPSNINESLEAGLANGNINPNELTGLKITVLATLSERFQYGPQALELAKRMPGVILVFCIKPTASGSGVPDNTPYRLAEPNESFSVDGILVHTIPALAGGMGYLVEVDGVKVLNAGFHISSGEASHIDKFRKEIDFLKPFGPVDIAILTVHSHSNSIEYKYEPYLYLLDQLLPKAIYLFGANIQEQYPKCAEVLQKRNIPVSYPELREADGERFHYLREQAKK